MLCLKKGYLLKINGNTWPAPHKIKKNNILGSISPTNMSYLAAKEMQPNDDLAKQELIQVIQYFLMTSPIAVSGSPYSL